MGQAQRVRANSSHPKRRTRPRHDRRGSTDLPAAVSAAAERAGARDANRDARSVGHGRHRTDPSKAAGTGTQEAVTSRRDRASHTHPAVLASQPGSVDVPTVTNALTTVQVAQTQQTSPPAAVIQGRAAQRGDRFHVVQRGESLWSIANDLLGDGASAARIAREVNRLWELNSDRIATGDPDLLMVGTRLALR